MKIEVDAAEVRAFAAELTAATADTKRAAAAVVAKGALNIKNQLRKEMTGRLTPKTVAVGSKIASTISYDLTDGGLGAEIGAVKTGAGNLANIAYFGGANGGGGTVADPKGALDAEVPRFLKSIADLAAEALT